MNINKMKFDVGGIWEESEWYIYRSYIIDEYLNFSSKKYCKHCYKNEQNHWVCPFVVVSINEGGHNSTGICLDCIIDAGKDNIPDP